jgi:hypothetical protein
VFSALPAVSIRAQADGVEEVAAENKMMLFESHAMILSP